MPRTDKNKILAQALCDAIDWRESLADGNTAEQVEKCNSLAAQYLAMLKKTGDRKPDPLANATSVSLAEIMRGRV